MKIGLYIVFSLLFIVVVLVGVYLINPATYSFDIFGIHMPALPVAVWVAMPIALLVIFSIVHMLFYTTRNFFKLQKHKADINKLEDAIYWSLIKEPSTVNYSNSAMKEAAALLAEASLIPHTLDSSHLSPRIKEVAKVISKIEAGEYVELKSQKFAKHLSKENPIILKNELNHIEADPSFALKVLDFKEKYSEPIIEAAYDKVVENEDLYTLKKYAKELGKKRFFKLLKRAENGEEIGLNVDLLKSFIAQYKLDCEDYYELAQVALVKFEPDDALALFKELSQKDEHALAGYLYLLFKYEMLDRAKSILEEHSEEDLKAFRAFYLLKKSKYNFKISDILSSNNVCK